MVRFRSLSWLALVVVALDVSACVRSKNSSASRDQGGAPSQGGTPNQSGTPGQGGTPNLGGMPNLGDGFPGSKGPALFYCETDRCIGIEERVGSSTLCRCVAQLPSAAGAGGVGGATASDSAGAGGELPPAPDPYPGPGCPVDPNEVEFQCGCRIPNERCSYGDFALCCVYRIPEDCGDSWLRCPCSAGVPDGGTCDP